MSKMVDIFFWAFVVAGITALVRPRSQGPALVSAFGGAASSLVTSAIGGGPYFPPAGSPK